MKSILRRLVLLTVLALLGGCGTPEAGVPTEPATTAATVAATVPETTAPDDGLVGVWHLEQVIKVDTDGRDLHSFTYTYEYNKKGDLVGQQRLVGQQVNMRWEFVCDTDGRRIAETVWLGDETREDRHYDYFYDEAGNLTGMAFWDGEVQTDEWQYRYDDTGRRTESVRYAYLDFVGLEDYHYRTITYTYDDRGGCTGAASTKAGESVTYTNTYDEAGRLTERVCRKEGVHHYTLTVTYDEAGRVTQRDVLREDYGQGPAHIRETYTYDENGNMTDRQVFYGQTLHEHYRYTYTQLRIEPQRQAQAEAHRQALLEGESVLQLVLAIP